MPPKVDNLGFVLVWCMLSREKGRVWHISRNIEGALPLEMHKKLGLEKLLYLAFHSIN